MSVILIRCGLYSTIFIRCNLTEFLIIMVNIKVAFSDLFINNLRIWDMKAGKFFICFLCETVKLWSWVGGWNYNNFQYPIEFYLRMNFIVNGLMTNWSWYLQLQKCKNYKIIFQILTNLYNVQIKFWMKVTEHLT